MGGLVKNRANKFSMVPNSCDSNHVHVSQTLYYVETFASTLATSCVRLLAAFACENNLGMYHFDAEQAFLQSELQEEIYLQLSPGCGDDSGQVVRLNKSLYGLKQAGRAWSALLSTTPKANGFTPSLADPYIFRLMEDSRVTIALAVRVDDKIAVGTKEDCDHLEDLLAKSFPTKNLGELSRYVGCLLESDLPNCNLKISQRAFIDVLLKRFDVQSESPILACQPYREAIGCLMWLANMTRPDIADSVRAVARYAIDPGISHWKAVRKILAYVAGTRDLGLTFRKGISSHLSAFADASYASKSDDRKSVSGGAVMYAGSCVMWFSRTQKVVTLSSTEAEYVGIGECVKEVLFLRGILEFFDPGQSMVCIPIFEDNVGAIKLAENPLSSARSRHIDVRHHFVRNLCEEGIIKIIYVPTEEQRADVLTKSLGLEAFSRHRNALMNVSN